MHDLTALQNRIKKNQRALNAWAVKGGYECYRLYERDIPELRFIVDRYGDEVVIYDKYDEYNSESAPPHQATIDAVAEALDVQKDFVHFKERRRMAGSAQYEKLAETKNKKIVCEGPRKYLVNLTDYLDSGLFLDHRPLRDEFQSKSFGTFLNLFCYTASVSVAAALGGAKTTSIDMSNSYISWARENFVLNGIDQAKHEFVREDVLKVLKTPGTLRGKFDTIFLDPPTFSNSKKMAGSFDVQRDHPQLIEQTVALLKPDGFLYFSCNRSKFRLDELVRKKFQVEDITEATIPRDFRNRNIHVCFKISLYRAES